MKTYHFVSAGLIIWLFDPKSLVHRVVCRLAHREWPFYYVTTKKTKTNVINFSPERAGNQPRPNTLTGLDVDTFTVGLSRMTAVHIGDCYI